MFTGKAKLISPLAVKLAFIQVLCWDELMASYHSVLSCKRGWHSEIMHMPSRTVTCGINTVCIPFCGAKLPDILGWFYLIWLVILYMLFLCPIDQLSYGSPINFERGLVLSAQITAQQQNLSKVCMSTQRFTKLVMWRTCKYEFNKLLSKDLSKVRKPC